MKEITLNHKLHYLGNFQDLKDKSMRELCASSLTATQNAYAPYSNFQVGAAVLLKNGQTVTGSNQENAVYPLGLCAERVALFASSNQYPDTEVIALAVATSKVLKDGELPAFPCGSCRQVILEIEQRFCHKIKLFVVGSNNSVCILSSVSDILPFAFDKDSL